ncbi:MAG: hypothetical protein U5L72_04595, partial [Bacteroidales bacterium]|nr:hypothetical protein [Bacteroidales bacterium]
VLLIVEGTRHPPTWATVSGNLNRTVECSNAAGLAAAQALVPVASDNCDLTLTPVKTSGLLHWQLSAGRYIHEHGLASDDCGNAIVAVYTQTITITDNTSPTWTTPSGNLNRTVECSNAAGLAAAQALVPVASDNCDLTLTPVKTSGLFVAGSCPQAGTYTNTWTVSDDCGNAIVAVYTQTITVDDTTNPTASNPAAVTVECIGDVPAPDITVVTDEADNCTVNPVVAFVSDVSDGSSCPEVITRTTPK